MTRIAVVGDIEGHLDEMYAHLAGLGLDAIFQVGDFGYFLDESKVDSATRGRGWPNQLSAYVNGEKSIPIPTYFIHGNHEDFDEIEKLVLDPNPAPDLHYLASGRIHDVLGLNVGVIGGVYSSSRYHLSGDDNHFKGSRRRNFSHEVVDALLGWGNMDMLLTHQGPFVPSLAAKIGKENCCPVFNEVLHRKSPQWHFYGHHDVYDSTRFESTAVRGLQTFLKGLESNSKTRKWYHTFEI